jgi:hypothetical protein
VIVEDLLELQRLLAIRLDGVGIGLDALQAVIGDSLHAPFDVAIRPPKGTRRAVKDIRVHRVQRFVGNRALRARGIQQTSESRQASQTRRGSYEIAPLGLSFDRSFSHGTLL